MFCSRPVDDVYDDGDDDDSLPVSVPDT